MKNIKDYNLDELKEELKNLLEQSKYLSGYMKLEFLILMK